MKKPIIYAISGVVVVGVIIGGYFAFTSGDMGETTTAPVTETTTVAASTTAATTTAQATTTQTTTSTTEATSAAETKKQSSPEDKYAFIRSGVYYVFDDSKTACFALSFKKGGKVNIAQFDESNIVYEDPQYYKGFAEYKIDGNKIIIEKMPENVLVDSLTLTAKDGALYYGNMKLENHSDVKLKYAAEHFND